MHRFALRLVVTLLAGPILPAFAATSRVGQRAPAFHWKAGS